jgi:hypothetical protein
MAGKQCLLPLINAQGVSRTELERNFVTNMTEASKYIEFVAPPKNNMFSENERRETVGRDERPVERAANRERNSETR